MNNLQDFLQFTKPKLMPYNYPKLVVLYTRVSSKEQYDNNSSIEVQIEALNKYAAAHGMIIIETFGGTYESGKSDLERKEFNKLFESIDKMKVKPFAVLVYKMSRFSRTGGSAIGLASKLVNELGVHIIEVSTGISTLSARGTIQIEESLIHARKENLERTEIIIPGMMAFVKKGNRFARAPLGYDHYGPRVKREGFVQAKQKIVINEVGYILREAFQWKLSGLYSDVQIIERLRAKGIILTKQKVSKMWRNPAYAGVCINSLVEDPVQGNWEPLISQKDFLKLQDMLSANPAGYQHKKDEDQRPLTRLLKCYSCERPMVGYIVKNKGLHYYRCCHCLGVSLNANTTKKARKKGANELFIELLNTFRISEDIRPAIELQLRKLFHHFNEDNISEQDKLECKQKGLEKELKDVKLRWGRGKINEEAYHLAYNDIQSEIADVAKELNRQTVKISNLEDLLSDSFKKLENLSEIWASSDLDEKRLLQKTLFPEGILYDVKKHYYLTIKTNQFIELISSLSAVYVENKNATPQDFNEKSHLVPGTGVEPVQPLLATGF